MDPDLNSANPGHAGTGKCRTIFAATLLCGTLDIVSAFIVGAIDGVGPGPILRFVASGPFGDGMRSGGAGAALAGLATHFALMALMVTTFVIGAIRFPLIARHWPVAGLLYGLLIYAVMYWLVIPARFGIFPRASAWSIGNALFSHIFCVGLPMAWLVSRLRPGASRPAAELRAGAVA